MHIATKTTATKILKYNNNETKTRGKSEAHTESENSQQVVCQRQCKLSISWTEQNFEQTKVFLCNQRRQKKN